MRSFGSTTGVRDLVARFPLVSCQQVQDYCLAGIRTFVCAVE